MNLEEMKEKVNSQYQDLINIVENNKQMPWLQDIFYKQMIDFFKQTYDLVCVYKAHIAAQEEKD